MLNQRNMPKCTGKPADDDRVICNWCQEKVLGKNYKRHQTDMDVNVMQTEAYASSMQAEENKENTNLMQIETEEITANLQKKRMRQQNLFETIGKFQQLQTKVSEILKEIEDPTQHGYLEKIRATLRLMEKAEADVRAYREKKRCSFAKLKISFEDLNCCVSAIEI